MKQNNVIVSDTDNEDNVADQTVKEIGRTEAKEKRSGGRPRVTRKSSTVISDSDSSGEEGEGEVEREVEKDGGPGNSSDIINEMVPPLYDCTTPVVQSKFDFNTNKVVNTVKKVKCGTKKVRETSSINDQEPEQPEDRDLDKTKTKKVRYPCAMCGGGVRSNAKECKACYKWVHYRCHVANNGIGWNEDPKKSDYRCPKCLKNIAGVIQKMMTKKGNKIKR